MPGCTCPEEKRESATAPISPRKRHRLGQGLDSGEGGSPRRVSSFTEIVESLQSSPDTICDLFSRGHSVRAYDAAFAIRPCASIHSSAGHSTTPDNGIPSKQRVCTVRRHRRSKSWSNRRLAPAAPFPKFNLSDIHLPRSYQYSPNLTLSYRQLSLSVELPVLGPLHHSARPKPIDTCKTRTYPDGAY